MKTITTNSKLLMASALMMGVALSPMTTSAEEVTKPSVEQGQKMKKGGKAHKHFRKMAKYLQLTQEQKAEIKSIREGMKAGNEAQREQMQAYQTELKALVASNNFTDANFEALYDKYEDTFQQKELRKAQMKNAIFQVLTDEQKVKWESFKGKKGKRGNK